MHRYDPRWLIVTLANLLLCWLVGLANNSLGDFSFLWLDHVSIHLYLGGLLVTYAALRLDPKSGLVSTLLTGLMVDALTPVPYGTSLILFSLIHVTVLYGRHRFPREGPVISMVVALFANLFLFIALSFLLVGAGPRPGETWLRIFSDLFFSQLAILVLTPWFIALQDRAMELAEIHPETGRQVHK
jgi:cell shape-determining protein MreD